MQSLEHYVKAVRWIQGVICVIPFGAAALQSQWAFAFPPLGVDKAVTLPLTVILAGMAAILPWALPVQRLRTLLISSTFLLFMISGLSYFYLAQRYIVTIPLPTGDELSLSVGNVRSPFAKQYFSGKSDAEMLMSRGPYENEVKKLWTEDSVDSVRFRLFTSYVGSLVFLNFGVGLMAKADSPQE